jgi:hypothetical protein
MSKIYSCRAEFIGDSDALREALAGASLPVGRFVVEHCYVAAPGGGTHRVPEVELEIKFMSEVPFEMLVGIIDKIPNGHRMDQTLKPVALKDNDMSWRDRS